MYETVGAPILQTNVLLVKPDSSPRDPITVELSFETFHEYEKAAPTTGTGVNPGSPTFQTNAYSTLKSSVYALPYMSEPSAETPFGNTGAPTSSVNSPPFLSAKPTG